MEFRLALDPTTDKTVKRRQERHTLSLTPNQFPHQPDNNIAQPAWEFRD